MTSPSLVAITAFFNPTRSRRRIENYRTFRAAIGAIGVPLIAVELSYGPDFELGDSDGDVVVRRKGGDVLWQKERLLNVALEHVPPDTYGVAWLDADIVVERSDWASAVVQALEGYSVVQVFTETRAVSVDGPVPPIRHSIAYGVHNGLITADEVAVYQPRPGLTLASGLGWAARADVLRRHGLHDSSIVGGGDRAIACAAYGRFDGLAATHRWTAAQQASYAKWAVPFARDVAGQVGVVDGMVTSLPHSRLEARRYKQRHQILARFDFDPSVDIVRDDGGCWRFSGNKPGLEREIRAYFESRGD